MSIYSMDHDALQKLVNDWAKDRPNKGRRVRVARGMRHIGKEGMVFWHGFDRYQNPFRYGDSAVHFMIEVCGTRGYRVGVQTDEGEKFFVNAEYVDLI